MSVSEPTVGSFPVVKLPSFLNLRLDQLPFPPEVPREVRAAAVGAEQGQGEDAVPPTADVTVHVPQEVVIGAGAVGPFVTLALARMGAQTIAVYDHDTVEEHDLPNLFYRAKDLGRPKVQALEEIVADYTDALIDARPVKYVDPSLVGVVIVAVDNRAARRLVWEYARYQPQVPLSVDTRMAPRWPSSTP